MHLNKKLSLLLVLPCLLITSCGGKQTSSSLSENSSTIEEFVVDKSLLFGMTDICYQEYAWNGINYTKSHELFQALGVKSVRFWAHATELLKDPRTVNESVYQLSKTMYEEIKGKYQIIGMNHTNFHTEYNGQAHSDEGSAKPPRDLTPGSKYMRWLDDYEESWYTLVNLFPDIEYWEIDNECNNDAFMHRIGGLSFTIPQMAELYYDMSYRASKGIHRANPKAKTVMGGMVVWDSPTGTPCDWLNHLYDLIEIQETWPSNNPDDFFQVACWHPYVPWPDEYFLDINNEIYNVVKTREGKDKKVFFTEAGYSDSWENYNELQSAAHLTSMYKLAASLYYVEALHYYRMYDEKMSANNYYGLFTNPIELNTKTGKGLAMPKLTAYAYQKAAGGTGDLELYNKFLNQ